LLDVAINAAPLAAVRTGVGRYIAGLLDALAAAKPDGVCARPIFLSGPAARQVRGVVRRLPFAYPLADARRAAILRRERPTVYHETNHAAPAFAGPVVLTVHDLSTLLYPETQDPARARHFARKLRHARRAARVIVPTAAIAADVVARLDVPAERVRVIHHGVDARFTPGKTARGEFVFYAGDDGPRKGLATLRAALPEGTKLELAGPGHGYVGDEELLALYRTAAVLVLPSIYEGFGFPLVEAMACGTPCIASDDPALVEVSGGAALHFPRGDAGALRLLLRRVLGDAGLRSELSQRALERARAFRWEESAARHVEVYREAAR
jgi:glycosyltransferase involved in cell wall biosynthesis